MQKVCVLGSGFAGLITAQVLLSDDFDVEVVSRDASPGGVWSRDRVYPGLTINNVHGEFRFSCLPMSPPSNAAATGGRLSGDDMCAYAERFADKFLSGRIRYNTLVTRIRRDKGGWCLVVQDLQAGRVQELRYSKLVLCTGGCDAPAIPDYLSSEAATKAGFPGPVFHSRDFRRNSSTSISKDRPQKIVIIGGGKSAQDIAANLAKAGHSVTMVFEGVDAVLATPKSLPLPPFIRRSRLLAIFSGHTTLDSRLERFLHTTRLGAAIVHGTFSAIKAVSLKALGVPYNSPLRSSFSLFWDIRVNDEGAAKDDGFFALANAGKIHLVAPVRAVGYVTDGSGVVLHDGRKLPADIVILATGYTSSWDGILDDVREELGLEPDQQPDDDAEFAHLWQYTSLANPPLGDPRHNSTNKAASLYRGLVPAANIDRRDFAINGALFTTNNGYVFETAAHWISSYFLRDSFLRLPATLAGARAEARMAAAWLRRRYPHTVAWVNESYSSSIAFWNWPQITDDLLADMGLRTHRSGGSWLTWPFAVIELAEIATLGDERRALRPAAIAAPY